MKNLKEGDLTFEYDEKRDVFCTIQWSLQDILLVLKSKKEEVTLENLKIIAHFLSKPLKEQSIKEGWLILENLLLVCLEELDLQ